MNEPAGTMTEVGIAVVEHQGQYLVGIRQPSQTLAGKAEFPGGKCKQHEAKAECAIRECREETGLQVLADELLYQTEHTYSHATVQIEFWLCRLEECELTTFPKPENGFQWQTRDSLSQLDFPEANTPVIDLLQQRK